MGMEITCAGSVGNTGVSVVGSAFAMDPADMTTTNVILTGDIIPRKILLWMEANYVVTTSGVATVQIAVINAMM